METVDSALTKIGFGKFHFCLIFTLGLHYMSECVEIQTLTLLKSYLKCHWQLTMGSITIFSYVLLSGMIVGSLLFGKFSNKFGRKRILIMTNGFLIYLGILSSVSPTMVWITIIKFFTFICASANSTSIFPILSEMVPMKHRATSLVMLVFLYATGSYFTTFLWVLVTPKYGWRIFLICSNINLISLFLVIFWLPESPRLLLLQNKKEECIEVLNTISKANNSVHISDISEEPVTEYTYYDLIHSKYLSTTVILCFTCFAAGVTYFGFLFVIPILNEVPHKCLQNLSRYYIPNSNNLNKSIDESCCFEITWGRYTNNFISTTGEMVFIPISLILINLIGRRKTLAFYLLLDSVGLFLLNFCFNAMTIAILTFVIRGSAKLLINTFVIYVSEVYPTSVRNMATGIIISIQKCGFAFVPLLVDITIVKYSFISGIIVLFLLNLISFIMIFALPYETKDRKLYQTADSDQRSEESQILEDKSRYNTIKGS